MKTLKESETKLTEEFPKQEISWYMGLPRCFDQSHVRRKGKKEKKEKDNVLNKKLSIK